MTRAILAIVVAAAVALGGLSGDVAADRPCNPTPPRACGKPKPTPTPTAGWRVVFRDDFAAWEPSRYFVYPETWSDTSGYGLRNSPGGITSDGQKLRGRLYTLDGTPRGVHFVPLIGTDDRGNSSTGLRVEIRYRADLMPGYKVANLLWPGSDVWPRDGEVDFPEGDFRGGAMSGFVHYQGATSGSDQAVCRTSASHLDWHTYTIEWRPGLYVDLSVDGARICRVTERVPNTPMHYVFQNEVDLSGDRPDPTVSGYVEADWLTVSVPS